MKIIETVNAGRTHLRQRSVSSVLVPTMGALHRGHVELIRVAREHAGRDGEVAVSIFVNPLQFEPGADFEKYPRPQSADEEICRELGVDLFFRPQANEMYAADRSTFVEETTLSRGLCGASRPGHFRGVTTVVSKLFNLLRPDFAIFGQKDYQQLAIIRRMVRDLNFPVEIIAAPTVRESDGLALSSRNQYLSAEERARAPVLFRALTGTKQKVEHGENSCPGLIAGVRQEVEASGGRVDYVSIVDGDDLQPLVTVRANAVIALAVFFGKTRLIDNVKIA